MKETALGDAADFEEFVPFNNGFCFLDSSSGHQYAMY
jgi:hypothetical protein